MPGKNPKEIIQQEKNKFQVSLYQRFLQLLMNSEEVDFQVLYVAVTLNVVIYFHPYVLYFRNIMELLSCFSDFIGVLTCGQDDETLHFAFEDGTDLQSKSQHLCVKF